MSLNSYLSCSYFPSARIRSMYVELPWWFLVYFILFRYFNLFLKWTYILFHLLFFKKSSPSQPPFTEPLQCSPIKYDNFFVNYWWVCVCVCLCLYTTVYKYNVFNLFFGGVMYIVSKLVTLYWTARRWHIPKRS